ncbi:MAG TPA: FAD/NAD(P)-binding protein [Candidatus Dormibacteraeota bacterium]|nr:FAD/NAD(P)-binding protein [Candidatus Dormibacteraeota bacterium]
MAAAEPAPGILTPRVVRVLSRRRETSESVTIALEPAGEPWLPGQFNMLYAFGAGEVPISISGDVARGDRVVHTVRSVGMVSAALCRLRGGDHVGVRGPFGTGWPVAAARGRDVLVVAGGVGLAPLRPVVYELVRRRADFGRVALLYGARTPADLLFRRELERWAARIDVLTTVDAAAPEWAGDVGVVTPLLRRVAFDPARAVAMVCGPEVMMRFTLAELRRLGQPDAATWISMERNMHCAVGLCGHCQLGPAFVCRDGPVFRSDAVAWMLGVREV